MAAVVLCLLGAGCGVSLPAAPQGGSSTGASSPAAGASARATGASAPPGAGASAPPPVSRNAGPVARTGVVARAPNPYDSPLAAEALIAFATEYINWNARTVSADMQLLASQSVGQARSAMELAAGETARDYELQRGGIANSGQVEGVSPLSGPGGKWVIVTRERTTATANAAYRGLAPEWHVIVGKAIERWPGRWAISLWQPES